MPANTAYNANRQTIHNLLVRFCEEWISLLAGSDVEFHSMSPELEKQMRDAVSTWLAKGDRLIPQFVGKARVSLYATTTEVANKSRPLRGKILNMTSRSRWQNGNGDLYRWAPQRLTIEFTVNSDFSKIVAASFAVQDLNV